MHHVEVNTAGDKATQYSTLLTQAKALCEGEPDLIANLSNLTALLKQQFNWWWTGFYIVKNNELVLGPFQGPLACTRIAHGKGVCGSSWAQKKTLVIEDVDKFPGHIACSSASRSEVVVPVIKNETVVAVLDVDSEHLAHFDEVDKVNLEKLARFVATLF